MNKIALLYSPHNDASLNIAEQLLEHHHFKKISNEVHELKITNQNPEILFSLINTNAKEIVNVPTNYEADLLIVLSTHRSKNKEKMLTAHYPGNWGTAEMGGKDKTLNYADSKALKNIFKEIAIRAPTIGFDSSLEADHHGPTCETPIIFVEIGPEKEEWCDKKAGKAIADSIISAFSHNSSSNDFSDAAFVVGGGHYPKAINKLILESNLLIGHIAPKYVIEKLDDQIFKEAIEKNIPQISKVIILKEETNLVQKNKIIELCRKFNVIYELL